MTQHGLQVPGGMPGLPAIGLALPIDRETRWSDLLAVMIRTDPTPMLGLLDLPAMTFRGVAFTALPRQVRLLLSRVCHELEAHHERGNDRRVRAEVRLGDVWSAKVQMHRSAREELQEEHERLRAAHVADVAGEIEIGEVRAVREGAQRLSLIHI